VAIPAFLIVYVNVVGELGLRERAADPDAASHSLRRIGRVIVALRMQIIAAALCPAVFLALGSDLTEQVDDLALRWPATPWTLVAAVVAALVLSLLLLASGHLSWSWYNTRPAHAPSAVPGWIPLGVGIVFLAGYGASYSQPAPWCLLLWPGLVFLAIGLVSVIEDARGTTASRDGACPAPTVAMSARSLPIAVRCAALGAGAEIEGRHRWRGGCRRREYRRRRGRSVTVHGEPVCGGQTVAGNRRDERQIDRPALDGWLRHRRMGF
jgi:hypothetical protein